MKTQKTLKLAGDGLTVRMTDIIAGKQEYELPDEIGELVNLIVALPSNISRGRVVLTHKPQGDVPNGIKVSYR